MGHQHLKTVNKATKWRRAAAVSLPDSGTDIMDSSDCASTQSSTGGHATPLCPVGPTSLTLKPLNSHRPGRDADVRREGKNTPGELRATTATEAANTCGLRPRGEPLWEGRLRKATGLAVGGVGFQVLAPPDEDSKRKCGCDGMKEGGTPTPGVGTPVGKSRLQRRGALPTTGKPGDTGRQPPRGGRP